MPVTVKYPLPGFLRDVCSELVYHKWLDCKADALHKRDLRLGRQYAKKLSVMAYKEKIHAAVQANDGTDPYTGDALRWDLIGKWNDNKKLFSRSRGKLGAFNKDFYLLPVADHIDPYSKEPQFQICSWIVNEAKSGMTPGEYVALCRRVTERASPSRSHAS
jgi:hypothetical protein